MAYHRALARTGLVAAGRSDRGALPGRDAEGAEHIAAHVQRGDGPELRHVADASPAVVPREHAREGFLLRAQLVPERPRQLAVVARGHAEAAIAAVDAHVDEPARVGHGGRLRSRTASISLQHGRVRTDAERQREDDRRGDKRWAPCAGCAGRSGDPGTAMAACPRGAWVSTPHAASMTIADVRGGRRRRARGPRRPAPSRARIRPELAGIDREQRAEDPHRPGTPRGRAWRRHHPRRGRRPVARASASSRSRRRASAFATRRPSGVSW